MNNHGPNADQLRLLLEAMLVEIPDLDATTRAGRDRAAAVAELDQELASTPVNGGRALALLNRIMASVGGLAAAGTSAAQLAAALQGM